ncbi:arsenate reductase ArsC [Pelagibaculum spongiae]|uniref:Low molecular weight phosphatase family protein n=1 Tax=Pelagibaculum spongiae TaxID=2080658 RepID=A0A2V1GUC0_9GAMM|nr:arsenate reductase ArsC [Pelagibaculum spongiae]PVZ66267.1 low molecular weight phosphatase family protein [Pelagibaculum spongiae]
MPRALFLCTGNSCRSIIGEALLNHLGGTHWQAFSAGSQPLGQVNPNAVDVLKRHSIQIENFSSQSWNEYQQDFDLIITVCGNAAEENCPVPNSDKLSVHWGLEDPAHATGTAEEIATAFDRTYFELEARIKELLTLDWSKLNQQQRQQHCLQIHQQMLLAS